MTEPRSPLQCCFPDIVRCSTARAAAPREHLAPGRFRALLPGHECGLNSRHEASIHLQKLLERVGPVAIARFRFVAANTDSAIMPVRFTLHPLHRWRHSHGASVRGSWPAGQRYLLSRSCLVTGEQPDQTRNGAWTLPEKPTRDR